MRIAVGIVGLFLMVIGGVVAVGALATQGGDPDESGGSDWSCYANSGSQSQDCSYKSDSPGKITYDAANRDAGVMIGCALFISGAVWVGAGVAGAGRPRLAVGPAPGPLAVPGPGPLAPPAGPSRA